MRARSDALADASASVGAFAANSAIVGKGGSFVGETRHRSRSGVLCTFDWRIDGRRSMRCRLVKWTSKCSPIERHHGGEVELLPAAIEHTCLCLGNFCVSRS
jgi:hypothetical protein